jgi:hypothetical protein
MSVFLSVDENLPLGIFLGERGGFEVVPLDSFFSESLIGLGIDQGEKYACEFERFVEMLRSGNEPPKEK